jgi:hypothetical protein
MVLQLCGRVCRRLSFENPVSNETGFFVLNQFVFFNRKARNESFKLSVNKKFTKARVEILWNLS